MRTPRHPTRIGLVGGLAATAMVAGSLGAAAPAHAAPSANGHISAYMYVAHGGACTVSPDNANSYKEFTRKDKMRKTTVNRVFSATLGNLSAADGYVKTTSLGDSTGTAQAFSKVVLNARHEIKLRNDGSASCEVVANADSQSGATVKVKRKGFIKLTWKRNRGYQDFWLGNSNGNTLLSFQPTKHKGTRKVKVKPGTYYIFAQALTRTAEVNLDYNETQKKIGNYTLTWVFKKK